MPPSDQDKRVQRTGQIVAITIAVAGVATIFAPVIVAGLGLAQRFEMLIYLCALAAMAWSVVVAWGLWRKRDK